MTNTQDQTLTVKARYKNEDIDILKVIEEYLIRLIEKELIG